MNKPAVQTSGIQPGETFTYRFALNQSGTYWYHAHADFQEQEGIYGPLIVEPKKREPYRYDREYTVLLFDWQDEKPERTLANLKKQADYYNDQQPTLGDLFRDAKRDGGRPGRPQVIQSADVFVDARGLIYATDYNAGLEIIEYGG